MLQPSCLASFKSFVFLGLYTVSKTVVFLLIIFFSVCFLIGVLFTLGNIPIDVALIIKSMFFWELNFVNGAELQFSSLASFLALFFVLVLLVDVEQPLFFLLVSQALLFLLHLFYNLVAFLDKKELCWWLNVLFQKM